MRLEEAAASGRQKASCRLSRRASCRRAPAAPEAGLGEMVARGGGFVSRPGLPGLRSRGSGSRGSSSAPIAACRVRSRGDQLGRSLLAATSSVFSGAAGGRLRGGFLPVSAAASCRRGRRALDLHLAQGVADYFLPTNVS